MTGRNASTRRLPRAASQNTALAHGRIESFGVYHFAPGEPVLSVIDPARITPQGVIRQARAEGIRVLAWPADTPAEFMAETMRLATEAGLLNLRTDAGFEGDIFGITMLASAAECSSEQHAAIEGIHRNAGPRGPHLELSLELDAGVDAVVGVASWIRDTLDPDVPLHLVGGDAQLQADAQTAARTVGLAHVYRAHDATDCDCGAHLVERAHGLTTRHFDADGWCQRCGAAVPLVLPWAEQDGAFVEHRFTAGEALNVELPWHGDLLAIWLDDYGMEIERAPLAGRRFMLRHPGAASVRLHHAPGQPPKLMRVHTAAPAPMFAPIFEPAPSPA